jgi:hypothetical protein
VTVTAEQRTTTTPGARFTLGALAGLSGHGLAFLAGFVAGQVVEPGPGDGFADLAAVAVTFLLVEGLVAVGCIVAAVLLRRRGALAGGILAGWAAGLAVLAIAARAS